MEQARERSVMQTLPDRISPMLLPILPRAMHSADGHGSVKQQLKTF